MTGVVGSPSAGRHALMLMGPGLIVAATGIGAGDVVSATVGGATYGLALLWAIGIGAFCKYVLNEGIARWQLGTGSTIVEGWSTYLPVWVHLYFGLYLVLWTVAVSAALTNATGLGLATLTGGRISQPWGAVLHSVAGCAFVLAGGFSLFEKLMKSLVAVMALSIVACAVLTFAEPRAAVAGLLVPTIPPGSGRYVLSLIGGIGGSVTILSYAYWMREEKLLGPEQLRFVRTDIAIAYVFTALFGMAVMLTAHKTFYVTGLKITDAQAVPAMASQLGAILGPFGFYAFAIGFWAAVFASLLGVWQSVPYLYADCYCLLKKVPEDARRDLTQTTSRPYRFALLFITLAPMPFAFTGRPLFVIVAYTVVGSLFVPFLAGTLLHMNNRIAWSEQVPRNHWTTNVLLVAILVTFAAVGGLEIMGLLR